MSEPVFWLAMIYACDDPECGTELRFLLEEGCEGPRDREVRMATSEKQRREFLLEAEINVWITESGRIVQPVPFGAGRCPRCNPEGAGRKVMGRFGPSRVGHLLHVRWSEDERLDPRPVGTPDGPHFRYDSTDRSDACGIPIYLPEHAERASL